MLCHSGCLLHHAITNEQHVAAPAVFPSSQKLISLAGMFTNLHDFLQDCLLFRLCLCLQFFQHGLHHFFCLFCLHLRTAGSSAQKQQER